MKAQQILDKLVQFNTVDDQDNSGIMKFLSDILSPAGFKIHLVKNKISGKLNLLAKFNQKKPVLTFSGHTDTVPATNAWTCSPFKLTPKGENLYGLGTGDMKGPIAAFISATLNTNLQTLKRGLNLVFTYGEEKELDGIQEFLKKIKLKTKLVIVGEDTGLIPVVASKGAYAVKIEFQGKAAHGADVNKGINAIISAQKFIDKLNQYFIALQSSQNKIFEIPFATLNVAKIIGGDLINRIPDYCYLEFEYRTINKQQGAKIYQDILEILRSLDCKFKIKLDLQIQPMFSAPKSKYAAALAKITGQQPLGVNGTCEGSFYSKYGYDCLVLGPGNNMAHQPNEYISEDQLEQGVKVYQKIISQFCQ